MEYKVAKQNIKFTQNNMDKHEKMKKYKILVKYKKYIFLNQQEERLLDLYKYNPK